jgi:hypothetical protein
MENQPQGRASDLKALAEAKFGKETLSDAEKLLLEKAPTGEWAICGPNDDNADPSNNPKDADNWGAARQIRAELLGWLCIDGDAQKQVHFRGIQVYGADITGLLRLWFVSFPFPLALQHCRLREGINLRRAEVSQLDFQGSLVYGMSADGLIVKNLVFLRNGFAAVGGVRLLGARIGGDLDCSEGNFTNPPQVGIDSSGTAFAADGIDVRGYVFFRKSTSSGEVRLLGAQIGGDLDCNAGTFTNPPRKGLPSSGRALSADRINVKGSIFLKDGFTARGEVRLLGAQVGGDLECDAGRFNNPPQKDLPGNGPAFLADRINVKGSAFFRNRFTANGPASLIGAQIGGDLDCGTGDFINPAQKDVEGSGTGINAQRIIVKGAVFLGDGFTADGAVNLFGTQIGGPFDCRNGNFQKATLNLTTASAGSLYDSGLNDVPADSAADSGPTIWPQRGELLLDSFVYGRISSKGRIDVTKRLDWLGLQPSAPFRPQPYLHLAKVLKDSGDSDGALRVREKMEKLRRNSEKHGPIARLWSWIWSWILKGLIGYGYHPGRAVWWILLLSVSGWIVYCHHAGAMVPTDKDACKEFKAGRLLPPHYPAFSPLIYSVENSLPLVKLGQADKWQPDPGPECSSPTSFLNCFTTLPRFVLLFLRMQILIGWLLATFFVAAVSGIVHKE